MFSIMHNAMKYALIFCVIFGVVSSSHSVVINLSHDGPVVLGANITFTAELINSLNQPPRGTFSYKWEDNAIPPHKKEVEGTKNTTTQWTISYPSNKYKANEYKVTVDVSILYAIVYIPVGHQDIKFNITENLNGNIDILQEDVKNSDIFVSNKYPVQHSIKLLKSDNDLINHATNLLTFWFVNCDYYGFSTSPSFSFNYTEEKVYIVEALLVASFDPLPVTTTTPMVTTPSTFISSSTTVNNTTLPIQSTSSQISQDSSVFPTSSSVFIGNVSGTPNNTLIVTVPSKLATVNSKVSTLEPVTTNASTSQSPPTNDENLIPTFKKTLRDKKSYVQWKHTDESTNMLNLIKTITDTNNIMSYACLNSTFVAPDVNKTYGYFRRQIVAKAPISKVVVKGNNWLQSGDVFNLNITCNGSGKFQHCSKIKIGVYNVTGEETCSSPLEKDVCDFTLTHYFKEAKTYTYVVIIMNDVSKVVTPAVIKMYKVTVQPQLSVIVVPVACSLLAVIIIVFGAAYYIQSRNRYTVEVADFDFGQVNDMEYKTFYERLREDISNMFNRSGDFLDHGNTMPSRSKYDNMEDS